MRIPRSISPRHEGRISPATRRDRPRRRCERRLIVALLVTLGAAWPLQISAQGMNYQFSAPDATIAAGSNQTITAFLDSSLGDPLSGFSFGLCSDPAVVEPVTVTAAANLAVANGGAPPDFLQIEIFNDGFTVGCVIDLLDAITVPPTAQFGMVDIEYTSIGSPGQTSALDFCDTLGLPPVAVVVVVNAVTLFPVEISGSLEIVPPQGSQLRIEEGIPGLPGSARLARVSIDTTDVVTGFSAGFEVIPGQLLIDGISVAPDLGATNGGSGPDLLIVDLAPAGGNGATVTATISTGAPFDSLGPGDFSLLDLSVLVGASAGAPCTSLPITFVDTLGAPPVPLEVTTATSTDVPNTVDGSVIISSLDPPAPSGGITLSAESRVVSPGSGTTIDVLLDSDLPIAAVSFGLAYQDDDVTLLTGSLGSSLSAFRCGAGPEFFSTQFFTSPPGVTFATVFDIQPPFLERELPAGSDLRLLSLEFVTSATPTTTGSDLTFTELGNPPVAIEVTTGTTALTPNTVPGSITFGAGFRRGDCNADGGIDISDAIFMLTFLFQPGGPTPTCDDACDGNDNGSLNIADPIGLLGVLFGQAPTMIPPPNSCGTDPTPDLLECDGAAGC